jgi:hypothetical protein
VEPGFCQAQRTGRRLVGVGCAALNKPRCPRCDQPGERRVLAGQRVSKGKRPLQRLLQFRGRLAIPGVERCRHRLQDSKLLPDLIPASWAGCGQSTVLPCAAGSPRHGRRAGGHLGCTPVVRHRPCRPPKSPPTTAASPATSRAGAVAWSSRLRSSAVRSPAGLGTGPGPAMPRAALTTYSGNLPVATCSRSRSASPSSRPAIAPAQAPGVGGPSGLSEISVSSPVAPQPGSRPARRESFAVLSPESSAVER